MNSPLGRDGRRPERRLAGSSPPPPGRSTVAMAND